MNIQAKLKNIKERPFLVILALFLFVEILYLIKCNFVYGSMAVEQDSAKCMIHMVEIVRNKRLLIPGWRYMTTHEIDSAMLLAIPFYIITSDVWKAFALSNTLFIFIFLAVILKIFKNCKIQVEYALAAASVMLIPYGFGMLDYLNMMFVRASQYQIKALIPLIGIMILTNEKDNTVGNIISAVCWVILLFLCGFSSGPLPLLTAIVPLVSAYIINYLSIENNNSEGLVTKFKTITLACGTVAVLIGFVLHQVTNMSPGGMDANVVFADDFADRMHLNIYLFLYLINGLPQAWSGSIPVVSLAGIGFIFRFVLGFTLILCAMIYIVSFFRRTIDNNGPKTLRAGIYYLVVVILVNFVIHLLGSYNAPRYYITEFICMIVLSAIFFSNYLATFRTLTRRLLNIIIIGSIVLIWYTSTNYINYCLVAQDNYGFCNEICRIAEENNVDNLITINATDVDEVCRILIPDIKVSNYIPDKKQFISYDWYVGTYERSYYGESSLIATNEYEDVSSIFGESVGANYEYVGEVHGFKLFKSDVFCLPLDDENYVVKE